MGFLWEMVAGPKRGVPKGVPGPDVARELVLYRSGMCGYCVRVERVLDSLGLELEMRDTARDSSVRNELRDRTGRTQVPCLFIDGTPLFESADIIVWLEAYARAGALEAS